MKVPEDMVQELHAIVDAQIQSTRRQLGYKHDEKNHFSDTQLTGNFIYQLQDDNVFLEIS